MLIDKSYFVAGPRHVLNATLGQGTTLEDHTINQFIAEYQEAFLCAVLGDKVGTQVNDYLETLDADGNADTDADIESVAAKLKRPFADYVFYHIARSANHQVSVTGVVKVKGANEIVSPMMVQVEAWNRMANRLNLFAEWVDEGSCPLKGIVIDENLLTPINRFNL